MSAPLVFVQGGITVRCSNPSQVSFPSLRDAGELLFAFKGPYFAGGVAGEIAACGPPDDLLVFDFSNLSTVGGNIALSSQTEVFTARFEFPALTSVGAISWSGPDTGGCKYPEFPSLTSITGLGGTTYALSQYFGVMGPPGPAFPQLNSIAGDVLIVSAEAGFGLWNQFLQNVTVSGATELGLNNSGNTSDFANRCTNLPPD